MPVFFRAGCNSGTCPGSARGKDGFLLSLFGYDAKGDYFRLTQELIGRRVNVAAADESLLLKKASGAVPHTGGKRFDVDSPYYATLLKWIEASAPDDPANVPEPVEITLKPDRLLFDVGAAAKPTVVTARYSDGSTRDVTKLALFNTNNPDTAMISADGVVTPGKRGDTFVFARFNRFTIGSEVIVLPKDSAIQWSNPPAHNDIDELVYDRLQKLHLLPSDPFFATFGRSRRGSICVCETRVESNLSQALHLLVGDTINGRVGGGQVVPKLLATGKSPNEIIEELFVRTLSRKPMSEKRTAMRELVGDNAKDRKVYEDIFGSLLQSTAFGFNH